MKTKIIASLVLGIFALMLLTSAVSAATLSEWGLTSDVLVNSGTLNANIDASSLTSLGVDTFTFTADGATADNWDITATSKVAGEYFQVTLSPKAGYNLTFTDVDFSYASSATGPTSFLLQYSKNSDFSSPVNITEKTDSNTIQKLSTNTLSTPVKINDGETLYLRWFAYGATNVLGTFSLETLSVEGSSARLPTFCDNFAVNASELDLSLDVEVSNPDGDEDFEWAPLNTVEVEVTFTNDNNDNIDLDNVFFELGLFKKTDTSLSDNLASDLIWFDEDENEVEVGDVNEGKDTKYTFKFRVDPDFDKGDYKLFVKAYPKGGEKDEACIDSSDDFESSDYYEIITITEETDDEKKVVVDVDSLNQPIDALCGEEVTLTVDVYNIGKEDFDEDKIMVNLYSPELGLDIEQVSDIGAGDNEEVTFTFIVPKGAEEKTYTLHMRTYADYDGDGDENDVSSYDAISDEEFPVSLKVEGACVFDPKLTVSTDKTSSLTTGQESVIKVTITNTGSTTRTFTVGVSGSDSWAKLVKFSPETLTLEAGKSGEVELTFLVNSDATGTKTFSLDLTEGKKIINQPVEVVVEKAGFSLFPGTGALIGNKNWYVWAIGALNIVLVLIIILVAVRLVKK